MPAAIDIDPNTFNLKSKGNFITCYIEISADDFDVYNIVLSQGITIETEGFDPVTAESSPIEFGDYNSNDIPDLMVKFDRQSVYDIVSPGDVELTVKGSLTDEFYFEGSDTVEVKDVGKDHTDEADPSSVEY